tara:strand:+ start:357 stop:1190 length:834 start_codon:yes stop_codon:yes gene_type:complete
MTLFISYGMTRSGSTLAFETEKAILEKYGMPQQKINFKGLESWIENYLPEKYLSDIDSLKKINQKTLTNFVVFKTHGAANKKLIEFIRKFNIPVTISVRDPKDIIISLLEISKKNRSINETGFINIISFKDALKNVEEDLWRLETWRPLIEDGTAKVIPYEDTIKDAEIIIKFLADLTSKPKLLISEIKEITKKRFTQFNIGIAGRGQKYLNYMEIFRVEKNVYRRLNNVINPFVFYKKTKFSIIKLVIDILNYKKEILFLQIKKLIKLLNFLRNKK